MPLLQMLFSGVIMGIRRAIFIIYLYSSPRGSLPLLVWVIVEVGEILVWVRLPTTPAALAERNLKLVVLSALLASAVKASDEIQITACVAEVRNAVVQCLGHTTGLG